MHNPRLSDTNFLIIAGTSKAGTTSAFNYFAGHPQVSPAEKETRFFLNKEYPLASTKRYETDGAEAYLSLFRAKSGNEMGHLRFEATPDYLYSANTADFIHQSLQNVRLIFILREPIARLISWYRFARRRGQLSISVGFDEYVEMQRGYGEGGPPPFKHPAFRALQHGNYSQYLARYLQLFGRPSIDVMFFEDLKRDPLAFALAICRSAGLEEEYFLNYRFEIMNKGREVRNSFIDRTYNGVLQRARRLLRTSSGLQSFFRSYRPTIDAAYRRLNVVKDAGLVVSPATRTFLQCYYQKEPERIKEMFDLEVPWNVGNL